MALELIILNDILIINFKNKTNSINLLFLYQPVISWQVLFLFIQN